MAGVSASCARAAALAALLVSVSSCRPVQLGPDEALARIVASVAESARNDVFGLPIEGRFFHYKPLSGDDYVDPSIDRTRYVNDTTRAAFRGLNPPWQMKWFADWYGYGFYLSLTPVSSRNYGEPEALRDAPPPKAPVYRHPWILYEVSIPKGSKILDIDRKTPLDPWTAMELKASFGCDASTVEEMFLMSRESLKGCRRFVPALLEELGVTALLYGWQSRGAPFSSYCAKPASVGLLLVGDLPPKSVRAFSRRLAPSGGDPAIGARTVLQGLFFRYGGLGGDLWPQLRGREPAPAAIDGYVQAHILGCGEFPMFDQSP